MSRACRMRRCFWAQEGFESSTENDILTVRRPGSTPTRVEMVESYLARA
jgi:hypothetical protein